ncbi:MAG: hypothetical protein RBR48_03555 [Bacilli bacterium]|jgi:hypothetical protein|nr:hypothetical protein [Bacilli bacterium]MDD3348597.1 hypothetical protein [Bacilli bacterium]MDY0209234.1 hypothetical protein [Bacilli bacterium]
MKMKGAQQAIQAMEKYIVMTIQNGKALLFTLKEDSILLVNDYINTLLTKNDFLSLFEDSEFTIYKSLDEHEEINQEHIVYKQ